MKRLQGGKIYVSPSGAILLSESVIADGHVDGALARVITHIHHDHIVDLRKSLRSGLLFLATPLTLDLLAAQGHNIPYHRRLDVSYRSPVRLEDYQVTLYQANHVPGAAEVLVEHPDGMRVAYTGDFKMPGTEVLRDIDILVIDATYGMPSWRRPWQVEIEYLLADIVNEALMRGPVRIYGYNGKMEEVMLLLRRMGVAAPFVLPLRKRRTITVLKRHGLSIGDYVIETTPECNEVKKTGWYIEFRHFNQWRSRRVDGGRPVVNILLTGWEFRSPYRRVGPRDWIVSFSDHADFAQLVDYVQEARPRLLVVDASRGGRAAYTFASYVSRKLGISALVQP